MPGRSIIPAAFIIATGVIEQLCAAARNASIARQSLAAACLLRRPDASRSITARQPVLSCAFFRCMQAAIREILGISSEQSRMASPVHISRASDENAWPGEAESPIATMATVKASTNCRGLAVVICASPFK